MKASDFNLENLWSRDRVGIKLFPLVMFLLRALRFDDINFREEKKL